MGQFTFNQINLPRDPAIEAEAEGFGILHLTLTSEGSGKDQSIFYREVTLNPKDSTKSRLDIDIKQNQRVVIELDETIGWFWSNKYSAITTKNKEWDFYSNLQYSECGQKFFDYDTVDESKRLRFVRFIARYNKNSTQDAGELFPYNLNINVINRADGKILPITFDPDIRNPPPSGG